MQPFLRTSTLGTALDVVPHRCRPAGNGDGRPAHAVLNKVVLPQLAAGLPNGCARRVKGSQTGADRLVPKSCWPPLAAGLSTTTAGTTATALSASLRGDRRRSLPAASNRAAAAPAEACAKACAAAAAFSACLACATASSCAMRVFSRSLNSAIMSSQPARCSMGSHVLSLSAHPTHLTLNVVTPLLRRWPMIFSGS